MRRFFCAILAFLMIAVLLLPVAAVEPQHVGISRVTQAVRETVGADTAGAAVVLFENGKRILYEGYGYADIHTRTLVTAETVFELGELSSIFVALAVQSLLERQMLELDRDIAYYLPAEVMEQLALSHKITIKDLLSGGAGFADRYLDLRYESPSMVFDTLEDALLADVPAQLASPGSVYSYSRFGITLAAFVVECVSGTDYATYVRDNILTPLGMTHTVLAPHATEPQNMAKGHVDKGEGSFAVAEDAGRTYSALWPADGAASSAADLCLLLEYLLQNDTHAAILTPVLENGIFQTGMAGFAVSGSVRAITAHTPYFGAALSLDIERGCAALILCNTADSALLNAAFAYSGFVTGVTPESVEGTLPDPVQFEGEYLLCTKVANTLYSRKVKNLHVSTDETGVLYFGDRRLVQIAPGIFADPDAADVAVVQFFTSVEGEVTHLITATGESYRPADLWEMEVVETVLFGLLTLGAVYFVLAGLLALLDAILSRKREEKRPRAWRFTVPWMLAAVNAIVVLVQILVCQNAGGGTIASFFIASNTVALLATAGALCGFVYALFTGFTVRRMTGRVARSAIIYVLFLALCGYWGFTLL